MTVEENQQALLESYNGTNDPKVQESAHTANQYTEMFKAGQITKDEYIQMMNDIILANNINRNAENMQVLEHMNTAINSLINIASWVV
jgi:ubiquinone biosynthesis protein UbiJ